LFGSLNTELLSKGMKHAKNILPYDMMQHLSYLYLNYGENSKVFELNSLLHDDAEEDNVGTLSKDDSTPGAVKIPPVPTLGFVRPVGTVSSPLPLGS
jgi:hypothetical protein